MKTIIIIAERVTRSSLSAVIPSEGVASVRVTHDVSGSRGHSVAEDYRSYRNPSRFHPAVRIELSVDDATAATVFDAVDVAYGAGFFSDAEIWAESPALALSA